MSRKARQDQAGAVHLVSAKGRDGELPLEGLDRECLLAIDEAAKRSGWQILARQVAAEGYHLLIRTTRANLSSAMQALQRDLARRRELLFPERSGPMFRDRYFSEIVSNKARLSELESRFNVDFAKEDVEVVAEVESELSLADDLFEFAIRFLDIEHGCLEELSKSADEKCITAAFIRGNCAISVGWIAEKLKMGHPSAASRGIQNASQIDEKLKLDLARMQLSYELQLDS